MDYKKIHDPSKSRKYREEAIELAFAYAPVIYPCAKCGHPVAKGYCCGTCGTSTPEEEE